MKIFIILVIAFLGCGTFDNSRPFKCVVVDVYLEDYSANDGVISKRWRTTLDVENRTRVIMNGRIGEVGDVLYFRRAPDGFWIPALPEER